VKQREKDNFEIHSIKFGSETLKFRLERSSRKTLAISVYPSSQIVVTAPKKADVEKISHTVKKRAPWILKQMVYFSQFDPDSDSKKFVGGESFRYLGRQLRLKVRRGSEAKVTIESGNLVVTCVGVPRAKDIKAIVGTWYRSRAESIFESRLERCLARFNGIDLPNFSFAIRKMDFRWGSCTSGGRILLNEDLVKCPSHCIDYVICHELAHLKHRNHTPEFFKLLTRVMPDWEARRKRLGSIVL
jgi:predicted metal-dependent hydrolase